MTQKQAHPWVTVDGAGAWVHIPEVDGSGTRAVLLSPDSVHVLIGELAEKAELLKTPDVQKKIASKLVSFGIDWLARRRAAGVR
jgi:hypothetical protein